MRINNAVRTDRVASGKGVGRAGTAGAGFSLAESGQTREAAGTRAAQPIAGIDALLAVQGVDDATGRRARAVRRGHSLLDSLEELRVDLLVGAVSPAGLDRLVTLIDGFSAETGDPRIDRVIAEIDLRARVELAKHGRL